MSNIYETIELIHYEIAQDDLIQELQTQIKELQQEIKRLKKRNN